MTDQKARVEKALHACAEMRVPDTADPWPTIMERTAAAPRRSRLTRFVPRARVGWVFAALLVLVVGTSAYAASNFAGGLFREELPADNDAALGQAIDQTQTVDGAEVTLEWAYADEDVVVVGYSIRDLIVDRLNAGNPAQLRPLPYSEEDAKRLGIPPGTSLADEASSDFDEIDGTAVMTTDPDQTMAPRANTVVFKAPEDLEPTSNHHFQFKAYLQEGPIFQPGQNSTQFKEEPPIGPFAFDFEVPVLPVSTIEVDQKDTTNGITLTLDRVENSPARPQAIVCVDPPDDEHLWTPELSQAGNPIDSVEPQQLDNNCWSGTLGDQLAGSSSVTVTELRGIPLTEEGAKQNEDWKTIAGPWTFDFKAPDS